MPSGPKNLMPLSRYGLCEADTTDRHVESVAAHQTPRRPAWAARRRAGRALRPPRCPAASAASSISPDSRVSRTIRTWGWVRRRGERGGAAEPQGQLRRSGNPPPHRGPHRSRREPSGFLALRNCGRLRAFLRPAFLRSFSRGRESGSPGASAPCAAPGRPPRARRDAVAQSVRLRGHAASVDAGHYVHRVW